MATGDAKDCDDTCYACRLTAGLEPLPGERIHETEHQV